MAHYIQERKDQIRPQYIESTPASMTPSDDNNSADKDANEGAGDNVEQGEQGDGSLYDDVIQNGDEMASIGGHFLDVEKSIPKAQAQTSDRSPQSPAANEAHGSEIHPGDVDLSKHPFMVNIYRNIFSISHLLNHRYLTIVKIGRDDTISAFFSSRNRRE